MSSMLVTPGALELVRGAKRVALINHASPDSDCVGGIMATTHALRSMGKQAFPFSPDPIPGYLLHVPGSHEIQPAVKSLPDVDLVVTIECPTLERLDPIWTNAREQLESIPILNIDHHVSNTGYGSQRIFDPIAASICEVLFRVFNELSCAIDPTIAYCLLTGIIGDTRSFRTSGTTAETLSVAGSLIAAGAPLAEVSDAVSKYRTAAELPVWSTVLGRVQCVDDVVWTHVTDEDASAHGLQIDQIDGIVEFLSDTRDVGVSVVFKRNAAGRIRISMRSDGRVDLTRVAAIWGGGGHPRASGCTITGMSLPEAEKVVIDTLREALRGSQ